MKTLKVSLLAAVAALALAHAPADAGKSGDTARVRKVAPANVSGAYSGALDGTIAVGGEMVVVPKDVTIVDLHGNRIKPGSIVSNRPLYVSGRVRDGKLVAAFIFMADQDSKADFSQETLPNVESDPERAR
jgi:hypothetical protein